MTLPLATRRLLFQVAIACIGLGLLAFAATDVLWARGSYLELESAKAATPNANWRSGDVPMLPFGHVFDFVGFAGMIVLLVAAASRNLPEEDRRGTHVAVAALVVGIVASIAGNMIDRSHEHEGAWGALQLGLVGASLVALVWRVAPARLVAIVGMVLFALRQPMIWRASDAYVVATGHAAAAYDAEIAKLLAHSIGAAGTLLLAFALFLAMRRPGERAARPASGREAEAAPVARSRA